MALGTLTSVASASAQGPIFFDVVTLLGDAAYLAGGTTSLKAQLRALRGDNREPLFVTAQIGGCGGYSVSYDYANDKLQMFEQDVGGGLAEVGNGDYHGTTLTLAITSR